MPVRVGVSSTVEIQKSGDTAIVTIDSPPVNALSTPLREGLLAAFRALAKDPSVKAIVVTGAGSDFIAGADLKEMSAPPIPPSLPDVILEMEKCEKPIVAAIKGSALGGGYEFALACDYRIGDASSVVGLPEVKLGIIPGAGGTQRLPRLTGIAKAIELITQGTRLKAEEALWLGMIDAIAYGDVVAEAKLLAANLPKRRLSALPPAPSGDNAIHVASDAARKKARGARNIEVAIEQIRQGEHVPFAKAVLNEREAFLMLRESEEAKALRHLFFAERESRKVPGLEGAKPRAVKRIVVLGAGTMGAGIAVSFADAGFSVTVIERDKQAAGAGFDRIRAVYQRQLESGRLVRKAMDERVQRIAATDDWTFVRQADLVIEAVFEDLAVKTEAFRRIDELAPQGAILATNTSYLDVNAIAAATKRPQDVIGLHFFSPANVMRLLEVVRGAKTAPDVLATGLEVARRIGKLPIVAGVCDGFIGNRIFSMYRRHAEYLMLDGASATQIDRAMEDFGFAMGPFAVSDLAGLDIAWAMRKRRAATRHPDERYVNVADRLCEQGNFGRKTGRGWYIYEKGAKPVPNPDVARLLEQERAKQSIQPREFTDAGIVQRLIAVMANEGAKVLAEGIALRSSDIDLVFANGYGFPSTKGGPMYTADRIGLKNILREAEATARAGGAGSETAPLLADLAAKGGSFSAGA
jgi:3-hydroxyacyl-CoA dehydrogenase